FASYHSSIRPVRGPSPPTRSSPFHGTFVVEAVLTVLDDGRDGLEPQGAVGVLHRLLQIEILDREMVVAVLVGAAHGGVVRLARAFPPCRENRRSRPRPRC